MKKLIEFDPPLATCCKNPGITFLIDTGENWGERNCPVHGTFRQEGVPKWTPDGQAESDGEQKPSGRGEI